MIVVISEQIQKTGSKAVLWPWLLSE